MQAQLIPSNWFQVAAECAFSPFLDMIRNILRGHLNLDHASQVNDQLILDCVGRPGETGRDKERQGVARQLGWNLG